MFPSTLFILVLCRSFDKHMYCPPPQPALCTPRRRTGLGNWDGGRPLLGRMWYPILTYSVVNDERKKKDFPSSGNASLGFQCSLHPPDGLECDWRNSHRTREFLEDGKFSFDQRPSRDTAKRSTFMKLAMPVLPAWSACEEHRNRALTAVSFFFFFYPSFVSQLTHPVQVQC